MSGFLGGGIGPVALKRRRAAAGNGLLNNLIAYWPLNEAGGANNALDLHTNALHLTQNSSPGSDTGKVYAAARTFNGSTQYFSRASEAALLVGGLDFTLAAWVNFASVAVKQGIFQKASSTGYSTMEYALQLAFGKFSFIVSDGIVTQIALAADSFGVVPINEWHLCLAWYDTVADAMNIQIDNGAIDSTANSAGVHNGTNDLRLGWQVTTRYLNGRCGPVAMWKSAPGGGGVLSEAQRSALWNGGAGLAYADFTP